MESGLFMTIIRNIIVAFSMYSRIPMPRLDIKDEDMKYSLSFIWLIGLVIAAIEYFILTIGDLFALPLFVKTVLWAIVPIVITGGFHIDGFMDLMDAFNSYKTKEEKLKILKDPHIGAFSVISLAVYGGFYISFSYMLLTSANMNYIVLACIGFILLRALGALLSITLTHAKTSGMLHEETKSTDKVSKIILLLAIIASLLVVLSFNIKAALFLTFLLTLYTVYFRNKCYKEFGGVNGDTIGYYITVGELLVIFLAAVLSWIGI